MFVRTSALVTNLGVHFKLGRENALAWVTTLDKGKPVAGAHGACVRLQRQAELAPARTDAQGIAEIEGLSPSRPAAPGDDNDADDSSSRLLSSARACAARDGVRGHLAFTWSRVAARHRALALQPAHQQRPAARCAPTPCSTARCCAPAKPCR
jgi:hypothetical protein